MKKHDDYISGPHRYWPHFFGGLVLGALLGRYGAWWLFDGTLLTVAATVVTSASLGFFCGRWGEIAWRRISDWLHQWWRIL